MYPEFNKGGRCGLNGCKKKAKEKREFRVGMRYHCSKRCTQKREEEWDKYLSSLRCREDLRNEWDDDMGMVCRWG